MRLHNDIRDEELVASMKAGDRSFFEEIYYRYFDRLYVHAYKLLKDEAEAMDVVHDLFTHLWEKRQDINIESKLASYLYSAVRNRILNLLQKKGNHERYLSSLGDFINKGEYITDLAIREKELSFLINKEIEKLPQQMRKVFKMSRSAGLSHKEIAHQLGTSEHTVRDQIKKTLKILRSKFALIAYLFLFIGSE